MNFVGENWNNNLSLHDNLTNFTCKVRSWNREVYSNIFYKKKRLKARLNGIQMAQEHDSHNLDILEKNLRKEFQTILRQEELLWRQKSRIQWISKGDRNTRFFHLSTIIRHKINKIKRIKINGEWSNDQEDIKNHIQHYFMNIFSADPDMDLNDLTFPTRPKLLDIDNLYLSSRVTMYEVYEVVYSINGLKAPAPDGYQPSHFLSKILANHQYLLV